MKHKKTQQGMSIVEAMVGISILSFFLITIVGSFTLFIQTTSENTQRLQATYLLEEGMEGARFERDENWNNISSLNIVNTYVLNITSSNITLPIQSGANTGKVTLDNTVFTRDFTVHEVCRHNGTDEIASACGLPFTYLDPNIRKIQMSVEWLTKDGAGVHTQKMAGYLANIF